MDVLSDEFGELPKLAEVCQILAYIGYVNCRISFCWFRIAGGQRTQLCLCQRSFPNFICSNTPGRMLSFVRFQHRLRTWMKNLNRVTLIQFHSKTFQCFSLCQMLLDFPLFVMNGVRKKKGRHLRQAESMPVLSSQITATQFRRRDHG